MLDDAAQIDRAGSVVADALGENLESLVLYGSAVAGGLRPDSDLDLLAVTHRELSELERDAVVGGLLTISGRRASTGPSRPIELTVIRRADADAPLVQLQYGEWLREDAEAGRLRGPHIDPDAVLLIAMARQHGRSLVGADPARVLPDTPVESLHAAIAASLPALLLDLPGDERNVVLTLARMLLTARTGHLAPKDEAAELVAGSLPADEALMLRLAAASYRGEAEADPQSTDPTLRRFVERAAAEIRTASDAHR